MDSSVLNKERTVRLFTYLKELSLLKAPLVYDLQQYENTLWFGEVPDYPECLTPFSGDIGKEKWMEIKKPVSPAFPAFPSTISKWVDSEYSPENLKMEPKLLERIANPHYTVDDPESPAELLLSDHSDVLRNFDYYMIGKWRPWYSEAVKAEEVQEVYRKLFSIYQKQKKLGEQFELVFAMGLLNWKTSGSQSVYRHLLTVPCAFQFDSNKGVICVIPSPEGIKPELEQDMLDLQDRLDNKAMEPILEKLGTLHEHLWNQAHLDSILRSFVQSLSANGVYDNEMGKKDRHAHKDPLVSFSPAIILRKRNEKGFQQACSTIIENTANDTLSVPLGIARIFNEIDDYQQANDTGNSNLGSAEDTEIHFPLDANEEQQRIISNLQTRNGVLVQGPPGTGKSHTIANLTSHLLATGKRVLITSQTPRALKVLKDKIPKELQALCVSLLGADSNSFKDLESVVQVISNKKDTWNPERTEKQINDMTEDLRTRKERDAVLKHQLRTIREKETFQHIFLNGSYKGTAQVIADRIKQERPQFNWLQDLVAMDADLPLTNEEARELLALLSELNAEIQQQLQLTVPPLDSLMSKSEFIEAVQTEHDFSSKKKDFDHLHSHLVDQCSALTPSTRVSVKNSLQQLVNAFTAIDHSKQDWIHKVKTDLLNGTFLQWEQFYSHVSGIIDSLKPLTQTYNQSEVTGQGNIPLQQVHADAAQLKSHLEKGNGLGVPGFRPKPVKDAWYIIKDVRIDGRKCDAVESVAALEELVQTDLALKKLDQMITEQLGVQSESISSRSIKLARMVEMLEPFSLLLQIKSLHGSIQADTHWHELPDGKRSEELIQCIDCIEITEELNKIGNKFTVLHQAILDNVATQDAHPIVGDLKEAILSRNRTKYFEAWDTVNALDVLTSKSRKCENLLQKIKVVLPILYQQLLSTEELQSFESKFETFKQAFEWGKMNKWFTEFSNTSEESLKKELEENNKAIKTITAALGAQKAWHSTLSSMTEGQRQHLLAWTTAMRKVGKGTGKNAPIHLRDAAYHMSYCRDSIPAWIMPLFRIFETFEIKPNLFDVVIIDEASQSGPEAVILQYIAKKLIVVGDDKQISPEYVGIKREEIQYLRKQYLYDFKLADMLDIENSFFDLSNVLFGGRITLREHFRCMPEIIQFSNKISYTHTPLEPLRQYPPNRLEPIKTRHIANGYREGSGQKVVNRPEAEAVVAQIKECIASAEYDGKTMGVISLQNEGQAQLIESLLLKTIGPEEMENRGIICGDAYAFQGDERDVMFISMVSAEGETALKALTTDKDRRRFNVAVSRAKDQLWLFHSPTANDFRNKECMRYQLITYCENPEKDVHESGREKCESDFESSVYDQIASRGYRIYPQYEIAGFRIDMVVEGESGRIAVECDGDYWHGPERYDYDMNRQRILERCGWKFWRVRGSVYYYNPEKAMESLWDTLKEYSIEPIGTSRIVQEPERASKKLSVVLTRESEKKEQLPIKAEPVQVQNEHDMIDPIVYVETKDELAAIKPEVERVTTISVVEPSSEPIRKTSMEVDGLKTYLVSHSYEVIDKRDKGGALWLIGGRELEQFTEELKKNKVYFSFAPNGSASTNKRPGWYTTYQG